MQDESINGLTVVSDCHYNQACSSCAPTATKRVGYAADRGNG